MTTFICRLDRPGSGPRIAVKDVIDIAGVATTAGCKVLADTAGPAVRDAACMAGARAADVAIAGKANLNELAFGASGVNQWFGTPVNPLDPALLPGDHRAGLRWRWPKAQRTSATALTPAVRCGSLRRSAGWRA